jgi:tRNA1(Val) A37 N6-methylase TrmN6
MRVDEFPPAPQWFGDTLRIGDIWIGNPPYPSVKKRRRPRKPTLASVAKQASKAALEVAGYIVKPDGSIVIVTGKGEQPQGNEVDEWIAKHADKTQRH